MTEVITLDVSTIDDDGRQTTFKIDDPKSNLTKNEVISAFNYAFSRNLLLSNYGAPIRSVGTTTISTSTKIELENETIYVTPSRLDFDMATSQSSTMVVTVTAPQIQAASVLNLKQTSGVTSNLACYVTNISYESSSGNTLIRVFANAANNTSFSATAILNIIINGRTTQIPITISKS